MSKIGPFIVGAAVGTLAALFLAPRSGDQTRALVTEKASAVLGEAKDFGGAGFQDTFKAAQEKGTAAFQAVATKGQEIASAAQSRGGEAFNAAAEKVRIATGQQAAAPAYNGDSDDLREKIEAARQRIAAQVLQNAEAANLTAPAEEAVAEVVEAAEETAEEVAEAAEAAEEAVAEAAEEVEQAE